MHLLGLEDWLCIAVSRLPYTLLSNGKVAFHELCMLFQGVPDLLGCKSQSARPAEKIVLSVMILMNR
jgi:hypothetical protein